MNLYSYHKERESLYGFGVIKKHKKISYDKLLRLVKDIDIKNAKSKLNSLLDEIDKLKVDIDYTDSTDFEFIVNFKFEAYFGTIIDQDESDTIMDIISDYITF